MNEHRFGIHVLCPGEGSSTCADCNRLQQSVKHLQKLIYDWCEIEEKAPIPDVMALIAEIGKLAARIEANVPEVANLQTPPGNSEGER